MPDIHKHERISGRFNAWRSRTGSEADVQAEQLYLDTALFINDYVDERDLRTIQSELRDQDSDAYQRFKLKDEAWCRSLGTVLYGKSAIEEYIHQLELSPETPLSGDEKRLLEAIIHSFNLMYLEPRTNPQKTLSTFFNEVNTWLENYSENNSNVSKTKSLCLSFYTVFKIAEISLSKSNPAINMAIKMYAGGDIVHQSKMNTQQMLEKIAAKISILQNKELLERTSQAPEVFVYSSLDNYYDCRCVEIFANPELPIEERLQQITTLLETSNQRLSEYIEFKQNEEEIYKQMRAAENVYEAVSTNQTAILRRQYAGTLLQRMETDLETLINGSTPEEQAEWRNLLNAVQKPSLGQQAVNAVLFVGSVLSYIPSVVARTVLSTETQENISNNTFQTNDSSIKIFLKKLANQRYSSKKSAIDTTITTIEALARNNASVITKMRESTTEQLRTLINGNNARIALYRQFRHLLTIHNNIQKLNSVEMALTLYIRVYNNFLMTICIWLYRTFGIALSDKAVTIAQIQDWQKDVTRSIQDREEVYNRGLQTMTNTNPQLGSLKDPILDQLRITNAEEPEPIPKNDYVTAYRMVATFFNNVTDQVSPLVPLEEHQAPQL